MSSKYTAFWYARRRILMDMITDNSIHIDVSGICMLGNRKEWSGSVEVNGYVKGDMAHAKALGNVLKDMISKGTVVKATISPSCVLRIRRLSTMMDEDPDLGMDYM